MRLIIANCTKQVHNFTYRTPEHNKEVSIRIPLGGQAYVHNDSDEHTLLKIVKQHEAYGLVDVSTLDHEKGYIGLCFSFGKPIDVDRIMAGVAHNDDVLIERSIITQEEQSIASEDVFLKNDVEPMNFEMEIVEVGKPGDESAKYARGVAVTRDRNAERNKHRASRRGVA